MLFAAAGRRPCLTLLPTPGADGGTLNSRPAIKISSLTRSVVRRNHAIIAPNGYINSNVPGWTGCTVNVLINEQMGARLCQTLVTLTEAGKLTGMTQASQIFFCVVAGQVEAAADSFRKTLTAGQFVYVPVGQPYQFKDATPGTQILTFHKVSCPEIG